MKRLSLALIVSLVIHILLLSTFFLAFKKSPLAGGEEGTGEVSVEIVGDNGPGERLEPGWRQAAGARLAADQRDSVPGLGSGPSGGTDPLLAEIRARIERAKRYPMLARRSEIEGVALVSFQINASGQPESVHLKSSSGQPVLDDEALATIQRAAPFPPYSKPLEIGIRFELKP